MLSFVIAEEDLWIETSYPFNEVTAVFLLNNPHYHHTSHSDEPLSYHCNGNHWILHQPDQAETAIYAFSIFLVTGEVITG